MKNIMELKEVIYAGVKLVSKKKWGFPKKHEQKLKTLIGNFTRSVEEI